MSPTSTATLRFATRAGRPTTRAVAALIAALALVACSGGSDAGENDEPATPASDEQVVTADASGVFDERAGGPNDTMPPGNFDNSIGPETIIATDDGQVPGTTTPPPPGLPDLPPTERTASVRPAPAPIPSTVQRIVSVSPSHTETLFAIGLGDRVVGVSPDTTFPDDVAALHGSELSWDQASVDEFARYEPDLVVIGDDTTGLSDRLAAAGIATFVGERPKDLDGAFQQMLDLATAAGAAEAGADLVAQLRSEIDALRAALPAPTADGTRGTFFYEIDPTLFTVPADGFISNVFAELGLVHFDPSSTGTFYRADEAALLSADPDVIVLADADCCGVTIDDLAARPGWDGLAAISSGAVVPLTDGTYDTWGPRLVDLLAAVAGGIVARDS